MPICKSCLADRSITEFYMKMNKLDKVCKSCRSQRASENYQKRRLRIKQIEDEAKRQIDILRGRDE